MRIQYVTEESRVGKGGGSWRYVVSKCKRFTTDITYVDGGANDRGVGTQSK